VPHSCSNCTDSVRCTNADWSSTITSRHQAVKIKPYVATRGSRHSHKAYYHSHDGEAATTCSHQMPVQDSSMAVGQQRQQQQQQGTTQLAVHMHRGIRTHCTSRSKQVVGAAGSWMLKLCCVRKERVSNPPGRGTECTPALAPGHPCKKGVCRAAAGAGITHSSCPASSLQPGGYPGGCVPLSGSLGGVHVTQ
jgi:hypothetical protein